MWNNLWEIRGTPWRRRLEKYCRLLFFLDYCSFHSSSWMFNHLVTHSSYLIIFFYVVITAWKTSIFGVFQVRILPHSDYIQTRKNPNTNTFNAVLKDACVGQKFVFIGSNFVIPNVSILMFPLTIVLTFITQKLNFHRKKGKWDIFLFSLSYFIFRL